MPVYARVKQTIRIIAGEAVSLERRLVYVVDVILGEFGQVRRSDILAVQDYRKRGIFDVTLESEDAFKKFLKILEENPRDERLKDFKVFPHFRPDEVVLTVRAYSPFTPLKEIEVVLGRYCKKVVFVGKVKNEIGLWTSKYRFKVILEKDRYPPARFKLGKFNLDCFFNGMPAFCKRCRSYGHTSEKCEACQNCGELGHVMKNCSQGKKCNFCFGVGHLYDACPKREKKSGSMDVTPEMVEVQKVSLQVTLPQVVSQSGKSVKKKNSVEKIEEVPKPEGEEDMEKDIVVKRKRLKEKVKEDVKEDVESESEDSEESEGSEESEESEDSLVKSREELVKYWQNRSGKEMQGYILSWPIEKRRALLGDGTFNKLTFTEAKKKFLEFIKDWKE